MDSKNTRTIILAVALLLLALLFRWEFLKLSPAQQAAADEEQPIGPFQFPYFVSPALGEPTFNTQNNVTVLNPALSGLSHQFIPMFGFVGMTAVAQ